MTRFRTYPAIELNGLGEWEEFVDCEAIIEYMLACALGRPIRSDDASITGAIDALR